VSTADSIEIEGSRKCDRGQLRVYPDERHTNRSNDIDARCTPVGYRILDHLGGWNSTVAKTLRRTTFRGFSYMDFEPEFKKLPPWDATTLWFYKELTDTSVLRLSQKLDIPAFREEIGVEGFFK